MEAILSGIFLVIKNEIIDAEEIFNIIINDLEPMAKSIRNYRKDMED